MKQTIIMIICILILVVGGVSEIKYLEKSSIYISSDLDYIKNAIQNNNFELADKQMQKTLETWEKTKDIWNIFIITDEMDDIEDAMADLKEHIRFENEEDCSVAIEKAKKGLEQAVQRQKLRFDNIL